MLTQLNQLRGQRRGGHNLAKPETVSVMTADSMSCSEQVQIDQCDSSPRRSIDLSAEVLTKAEKRLKKGFSLIEIMIVILIIGVLMAGVFGGFAYVRRAKESSTNTKLSAVDSFLEQYNLKIGQYPQSIHELITGPEGNPALMRKWGEQIASEDELKDAWGHEFIYAPSAKGSRPPYDLYSGGSSGTSQIRSPVARESGPGA